MRSFEMNIETGDELAAVNEILGTIGEPPVSTLEGDANADVASARRILNMVNRRIQMQGWTFNIEENLALLPDTFSNLIPYSSDYLSLMSTSGTSVYVNRGGYIFDRTANTDRFTGPIEVRIIRLKGFEEMPECFRHWIVTAAAKKFNASFFGAPEVDGATSEDLIEARRVCMEWEMDYGKFNMLDGDAFTGGKLAR